MGTPLSGTLSKFALCVVALAAFLLPPVRGLAGQAAPSRALPTFLPPLAA